MVIEQFHYDIGEYFKFKIILSIGKKTICQWNKNKLLANQSCFKEQNKNVVASSLFITRIIKIMLRGNITLFILQM